jgi:hypothetical protein
MIVLIQLLFFLSAWWVNAQDITDEVTVNNLRKLHKLRLKK